MKSSNVLVGKFGSPHGIRGDIKLLSYTEDPFSIRKFKTLKSESGDEIKIIALRRQGKALVATVTGIDSRDTAESLVNQELFIDRSELPDVEETDSFYHADLVDLMVLDADQAPVGQVIEVHNFGSGDLLEIAPLNEGKIIRAKSWYLAFTKKNVPMVSLEKGEIIINIPDEVIAREQAE